MRVLLLNQAFVPDVVSSAQHAGDLARALGRAGHQVTVIASRRAYDEPARQFPARENWNGVSVRRVWHTGFGKGVKWRRAADFATFFLSCCLLLLRQPKPDVVVTMTTPPLLSVLAAAYTTVRGGRLVVWLMDLNPDQAIAAGWLRAGSVPARLLSALLRFSLRRAERVVVLDHFMKDRTIAKGIPEERIAVIPPWSHDDAAHFDPQGRRAFRASHGFDGKFVVMYSGNHSPCHPLDTLLQAAERIGHNGSGVVFCFIGGGSQFPRVKRFAEERGLGNVICLPYQPLADLPASLSSADLHAVVMGDPFVGIVHPCKVYNIMRLGSPILYIGPPASPVEEILELADRNGRPPMAFRHGDVDGVVNCILERAGNGKGRLPKMVQLSEKFSNRVWLPQFAALLENASPNGR
jgi:colanic acid biosynthesis glycosyl transferase WcaI